VPKIFKLADYVALLSEGVIQENLTPEEFQMSANPVVREYVKATMGTLYTSENEEKE
jgi:phospholipid/cholesterol/gamma-HCH transport system ATP-binding protein